MEIALVKPLELSDDIFRSAIDQVAWMVGTISQGGAEDWAHDRMEGWVEEQGREFQRRFLQGMMNARSARETRHAKVVGADLVERTHRRPAIRPLTTVVGDVEVVRTAYAAPEHPSVIPLDAALSMPDGKYSNGLKKEAALESLRGSFEDAQRAIERHTGVVIPKRQLVNLVLDAATDFESFYEAQRIVPLVTNGSGGFLVLSCDGKGVVMRPEGLREATRKAAEAAAPKLKGRLSKGEKGDRKRMATVAAVYEVAPFVRLPEDVLDPSKNEANRPRPTAKRVWARLDVGMDEVVRDIFDEAEGRDPKHERTWVVLVDGANQQIDLIRKEARRRKVRITIVVDFIHALEYLWKAAWEVFAEGDPKAEEWVQRKALELLRGNASLVAAAIRRTATNRDLPKRTNIDKCADYFLRKSRYLRYDLALANGYPIATGVIEGTCRHLVVDRMDITGARWSLDGGEAILRLRSLWSSGDFEEYWQFHLTRVHERAYPDDYILSAA